MNKILVFMLMFLMSCSMGFLRKEVPKSPDNSVPVVTEPTPTQPSLPADGAGDPVLEPKPEPIEEPQPVPVETPKPVAPSLKVNIKYFGSASTTKRKEKYEKAIEVFKKVVASDEFKSRVISHKYNGEYGYAYMSGDPNKRTSLVYEHILAGNEKLQPEKDGEVDMEVEFYYANNSTVGYTYPNVKRIYVNTKFFDGYKLSSVAANLIHEWLHKLGYGHDSASTSRRPYSVPYGVGSIMRSLGSKYE